MVSIQNIIYCCCFCLFPQLLLGQTASLMAKVIDAESKEPLAGANLFLQSDILGGTYTDEEGQFQLITNSQKTDTLFISYLGYQSEKIAIPKDYSTLQTIELQANTFEVAMVEIKATRIIAEEFSVKTCLLYTSPSPRDATLSRMPSSA